jgi:hypothetical protein
MTNPLRFFRRRTQHSASSPSSESPAQRLIGSELEEMLCSLSNDDLASFDIEELQEFITDPEEGPTADPAFKEQLRRELWRVILRIKPDIHFLS